MPPQRDSHNAIATAPIYSHKDLQILHQIVSLACHRPSSSPFRTIFNSYEAILAARRIPFDSDSIYFRFLIQLGQTPGRTIFDKFLRLLGSLGIDTAQQPWLESPATKEEISEFTRARYENARRRRDESRAFLSEGGGSSGGSNSDDEESDESVHNAHQHHRTAQGDTTNLVGGDEYYKKSRERRNVARAERSRLRSRTRERRRRRPQPPSEHSDESTGSSDNSGEFGRGMEGLTLGDESDEEENVEEIPRNQPPAQPIRSIEEAEADANQLFRARENAIARNILWYWQSRLYQRQTDNERLDQEAKYHYKRRLVEKAWTQWRNKFYWEMQGYRAELYWIRSMQRKVFYHWTDRTMAVIHRTEEVKERILARKFFNAWKAIVEDNQARIRYFQLSRALLKWRQRLYDIQEAEAEAEEHYRNRLAGHTLIGLLLRSQERHAEKRYDGGLIEAAWSTWLKQTDVIRANTKKAYGHWAIGTVRKIFNNWLARTDDRLDQEDIAQDHYEWKLISRAFEHWRQAAALQPRKHAAEDYFNDRLKAQVLNLFRERAHQYLAAEAVHNKNIKLRALKKFTMAFRLIDYQKEMNHRLVVDTLYNWVLLERLRLFQRVQNRKLVRSTLSNWRSRLYTMQIRVDNYETHLHTQQENRLLLKIFSYWRARNASRQARETFADSFYERKLSARVLKSWKQSANHYHQLDFWARDARYYLLLRPILSKWKRSRKHLHHDRLRTIFLDYTRARRREQARDVLQYWHGRTIELLTLHTVAENYADARIVAYGTKIFHQWVDKTNQILDQSSEAESHHQSVLVHRFLTQAGKKLSTLSELDRIASYSALIRDQQLAQGFLRKWSLRLFHIRSQNDSAERFVERRENNRLRSFFRRWKESAEMRREARLAEEQTEGISYPSNNSSGRRSRSNRPQQESFPPPTPTPHLSRTITQNMPNLAPVSASMPAPPIPSPALMTPGLASPSKRAERNRKLALRMATPHHSTAPSQRLFPTAPNTAPTRQPLREARDQPQMMPPPPPPPPHNSFSQSLSNSESIQQSFRTTTYQPFRPKPTPSNSFPLTAQYTPARPIGSARNRSDFLGSSVRAGTTTPFVPAQRVTEDNVSGFDGSSVATTSMGGSFQEGTSVTNTVVAMSRGSTTEADSPVIEDDEAKRRRRVFGGRGGEGRGLF